jgi:hypothetical protein
MAKKAKKVVERSNVSYMQKLIKKSQTSARGNVAGEMNLMLTFLINNLNTTMGSVVFHYSKKEGTLRPKLAQAAFQAMLHDELRTTACEAGAQALLAFAEKNANKSKKSAPAEAADEGAAVEA